MKPLLLFALLLLDVTALLGAEPSSANVEAFHRYAAAVESRLATQHRAGGSFVLLPPQHLAAGQIVVERLNPAPDPGFDGAMVHHWRATAFAPGAKAADLESLLRDFNAYPQRFAPQVIAAHVLSVKPNWLLATMRVRQHHVLTVVLDTTYEVTFAPPDPAHGYSISHSTRVDELSPDTLQPIEQQGFLWCQNTYWSWQERDGGLYLQLESLTLTRAIPTGLAWAARPFVESIPRDSLEFTLRSAVNAIRR